MKFVYTISLCFLVFTSFAQQQTAVYNPDNGDGTYTNPVIHADYSDPDVIRVGENFYMIASSFHAAPGLPILQSKDLVNWQLIGYALSQQIPVDRFNRVQHGGGVWAPSIRYHKNEFYIYYPDPDEGIYLIKANNILGPWSAPKLIANGKGLIDPAVLWDDDGKTYLVHAYAGSRAGFKSILVMKEMNRAGDSIIGKPVMVYDGHNIDPTIEGPKIHKRNGYYYIFAPAGGVSTGWQLVLRSRNIYGPYERKVVMDQGNSSINGPHQGAWINTLSGTDWFIHFQDKDAYGRVVHLQPMVWKNDWPVIGVDDDGDGKGNPVLKYKKPVANSVSMVPPTTDEFNSTAISLQWQWQANEQEGWAFPSSNGYLRLMCKKRPDSLSNFWHLPNMLLQKFPAETFTATTKIKGWLAKENDQVGMMIVGLDYAFFAVVKKADGHYIQLQTCTTADKGTAPEIVFSQKTSHQQIYFRANVNKGAACDFSFSEDGKTYQKINVPFIAKPGKWVGAKIGLLATGTSTNNDVGYADVDYFRIQPNNE